MDSRTITIGAQGAPSRHGQFGNMCCTSSLINCGRIPTRSSTARPRTIVPAAPPLVRLGRPATRMQYKASNDVVPGAEPFGMETEHLDLRSLAHARLSQWLGLASPDKLESQKVCAFVPHASKLHPMHPSYTRLASSQTCHLANCTAVCLWVLLPQHSCLHGCHAPAHLGPPNCHACPNLTAACGTMQHAIRGGDATPGSCRC
jgi:hypothetical protein